MSFSIPMGRWPEPSDMRGLWDVDGTYLMQVVCPHTDTSRHHGETHFAYGGTYYTGTEYCNTCGARRLYR